MVRVKRSGVTPALAPGASVARRCEASTWQPRYLRLVEIATRPFISFKVARNDTLILLLLLLTACTPSTPRTTPQVVSVYSTYAAEPWLTEIYNCAAEVTNIVLSRVDDPSTAEIILRIGEPEFLSSSAFQIDEEEILIVTHRQSPIQNLNLEGVRALFMGLGDPSVQVWVYASDADVQGIFDQLVMEGRSVVSSASVAFSPQHMSDTLVNEPNTVGILPRHWKVGDVREVYSIGIVPVLALAKSEPSGVVKDLLGCLQ